MADNENCKNSSSRKGHEQNEQRAKKSFNYCSHLFVLVVFAVGLVGGTLIGIYAYHGNKNDNSCLNQFSNGAGADTGGSVPHYTQIKTTPGGPILSTAPRTNTGQCPNKNPKDNTPYESSLFAPLTVKEMTEVSEILWLGKFITTVNHAPRSLEESFILYMYLFPPRKEDAIEYLYNNGSKPGRYAKVHIQRGAEHVPDIMEYKVGPLGHPGANVTPLTKPGEIHFNSRPYDGVEVKVLDDLLHNDMKVLETLMRESFDNATFPNELYIFYYNGPPRMTTEGRETRFVIGFPALEELDVINLLPLSGTVHNPGNNVSDWHPHSYYYLNQGPYSTVQGLVDAYKNNTIRKLRLPAGYRNTLRRKLFPEKDNSLPLREYADHPGARSYMPKGPRFSISGTNVKWMDWSFHISGGQLKGPALFDIRFKGNRIAYELAVNDIALEYAMDASGQNSIIYMDATYGIMGGVSRTKILNDVDCPSYAVVFNTSYWDSFSQKAFDMESICVFEADGQEALWRHVSPSFAGGMRNRHLIVRVPVVVGNYDYTLEFQFYLDGKIYTMAKASGYIQASFWDEHNPHASGDKTRDAFGYRVFEYQTGPIHDHMFGFKVDMDVIDSNNSLEVVHWKAGNILDALRTQSNITQVPPYFIYNQTRYVEYETMQEETGFRLNYDHQKMFVVVNENKKNKWGVKRGYQIAPLATGAQSLPDVHPAMKALSFTKYHVTVTKRKEEEPYLSSIYDINRMNNPKGYLDLMLNNESIVNEDLVNWVTVGFLHVPSSEDIPMTARVESGFLLKPFNFFDKTATFDMPQYYEEQGSTNVEHEPAFDACVEPNKEY
ncbi:hypothetical protein CHS0354_031827 [Potamilus streckersoni]|uniref:Amine oxidase n=1 Tax=Potamilus streckersoni TaxID=2493646 RepID=A0AAE0VLQ4_9BIVA|nr:hypothetical protein CHS0354_031827 [Potamilus streckersoni]